MKNTLWICIALIISDSVSAQQYAWTQKADYGGGEIYDAFSFAIGTKGYAGSGFNVSYIYNQSFWEWDQATNVWTQKANYPGVGREGARGFVIGNKGYVTTGYGGGFKNDLWEYDQASNTWTSKSALPATARYLAVAFSLLGKGYVGLGSWMGNNYLKDLWQYDPATDSWTQKADFPGIERGAASRFVINNEAYVGLGSNVSLGDNYADFYKYNPVSNSWTKIADFIGSPRNGAYSFAIADSGYIVCGYDGLNGSNTIYPDFYRYNSINDSWLRLPDFPGNKVFEGIYFEIGVCGYMGIGSDASNFSHYQRSFWEYGPVAVPPPVADFQSSDSVICALTCATFTDASSNATSWEWSFPGAIPTSSTFKNPGNICYMYDGSYDVTLIVSNAAGRDTLTITKYITVLKAPPTPVITQNGDSLLCSYDTSYSSYQWYVNGSIIPGATGAFYVHQQSGNYNVAVTNKDGCSIAVGIILAGEELNAVPILIFPNPSQDWIIITLNKSFKIAKLSVYDVIGRRVIEKSFEMQNEILIDIRMLSQGCYWFALNLDGKTVSGKFTKSL